MATDGGSLVGHVTLYGADVRTRSATLAVMIGREHLGHGYGSDAVRVLVRYGSRSRRRQRRA